MNKNMNRNWTQDCKLTGQAKWHERGRGLNWLNLCVPYFSNEQQRPKGGG